jgi:hypothetical protein
MYVPFENIDHNSRLWVFQADRFFSDSEEEYLNVTLKNFTQDWTSHNHVLESSFLIESHKFIILAVNESVNDASGCSIDKSVKIIKTIEEELRINLLDKTSVAFLVEDQIKTLKLSDLKAEIAKGSITENTLVFNTLVSSKAEYLEYFKCSARQTWLKRYFVKSAI